MSENGVICVVVIFDIVIVISQMFQKIEQHGKSMLGNGIGGVSGNISPRNPAFV